MPAYAYGGYVYINNNIDAPNEHHNKLILNQEPAFYITLISNFMDKTLTLLPKLFINKMDGKHIKVVAQLSKVAKLKKSNNRRNQCLRQ